jgi:hypothetical protein
LNRLSRTEFESYIRPQLRAFIAEHAHELGGHTVDETQAVSDLYDLVHDASTLDWAVPSRGLRAELPTPCTMAVAGVAVSSVALVIQAAGVPANVSRAIGTSVVDAAIAESPITVTTLEVHVTAIMNAADVVEQTEAILGLFGSIANVVDIGKVVDTTRYELSSYQRMLVAVVIAVQLTLWFPAGAAAAADELVPFGSAIAGLVISAQQAYQVCHPTADGLSAVP